LFYDIILLTNHFHLIQSIIHTPFNSCISQITIIHPILNSKIYILIFIMSAIDPRQE
jgi:hypothetical protein